MISPRVLERRESGQNFSDSVTEQSDNPSVTQDDPREDLDLVHQAGQRSAILKQLEVLAHLLGSISSENFSCYISIAKFE